MENADFASQQNVIDYRPIMTDLETFLGSTEFLSRQVVRTTRPVGFGFLYEEIQQITATEQQIERERRREVGMAQSFQRCFKDVPKKHIGNYGNCYLALCFEPSDYYSLDNCSAIFGCF